MIAIPAPPICSARIGLRLLRPELGRAILRDALATRPMGISDLCAQLMLESDTSLREQLEQLEGVGAIEKRKGGLSPGGEFHLTPAGQALIEVAALVGAWLTSRPGSPLSPEGDAGWRAFAALADAWEVALIHHLLVRASSRRDLLETIPVGREKLKRMLRRLRGAGLLRTLDPDARAPRYVVTVWARRAIGVLLSVADWERAHLRATAQVVGPSDGVVALLASLPLIRPPKDIRGICAFTVEPGPGDAGLRAAAAWIRLADGRVTACRSGAPPVPPDAWAHGDVDAWIDALLHRRRSTLHLGGDRRLAECALHGVHAELFEASVATS
jgi:DNA-binding HxlR family transcriptional regulator